jgi:hypothetical protein
MAITYKLEVLQLSAYPVYEGEADVVFSVLWRYTGKDDRGYSSSRSGSTEVTYYAGSPFTPYAELTEEQVIGWIEPLISEEEIITMEIEIEGDIQWTIDQESSNNPVTPPLPWG